MDEENLQVKLIILEIIIVFIFIAMAILAIKCRETADKVDKLAEQKTTEQTIEKPTTQQATTEAHIEPSDDEIQIELREEFKGGGDHK